MARAWTKSSAICCTPGSTRAAFRTGISIIDVWQPSVGGKLFSAGSSRHIIAPAAERGDFLFTLAKDWFAQHAENFGVVRKFYFADAQTGRLLQKNFCDARRRHGPDFHGH